MHIPGEPVRLLVESLSENKASDDDIIYTKDEAGVFHPLVTPVGRHLRVGQLRDIANAFAAWM